MIFGRSRLELKVGIFVFIGLVILAILLLLIGDIKTWGGSRKINFIFNFVNGVKLGAPVRYSGVDVGEVKDIIFVSLPEEKKSKVKVISLIRNDINVPVDSTVWVNTLGLLGEKYIEIIPGKNYTDFIGDNADLIGRDPIAMHEVTELAKSVVENINEAITKIKNKEGTVGKLLYDDTVHQELVGLLSELETLTKEAEGLVADIKAHPWKLFYKSKSRK
jgi:phospholipid/cholesterol/gamma-HCH transport system substrate-binding protein